MNQPAPAAAAVTTPGTDLAEIQRIFAAQRATALRWRTSTAKERRQRIRRLYDAVRANEQAIIEAGHADFGKPASEVVLTEVLPVLMEARDAMRHLRRWMRPTRVLPTMMMAGSSAWIQYEPKGRALIVSPWNYPFNLSFGPMVSALAAGCPVILKPSEMTPHMSALMKRIVGEVFAEDEVAVIEGEVSASTALLELPFDHIFFTGSPAVGKVVMAAAARHLASVTLELGGKSPTIIDASADLDMAARNIAWGKLTNNGQTCIAPDHIYVHDSVRDAFVDRMRAVISESYGEDAAAQQRSPYLARVVNQRHAQRIASLLDDARQQGATVLAGGEVDVAQRFIAPTLLTDLPPQARIMEEEIFGPLLPIIGFRELDEVIDAINAQPKPLALYIWSRTQRHIDRLLKETSAGGTCINHTVVQFAHARLPFGGVNNSGIGNAHGLFGFKAFSHERAVVRARIMTARFFFPPHNWMSRLMIGFLKRFA